MRGQVGGEEGKRERERKKLTLTRILRTKNL